jgi:3-isopropylmalate/(R)-2-methylmalate dehydratase small subunit
MNTMQPFTRFCAVAAPLDEANVDTNQLCPTRFNKVPRGPRYRQILFHDLRFDDEGSEKDFFLNREPYRNAGILVSGRNFGCGSARESAVYGLYEFGIRCVIASSFGDIFRNNAYRNGLLPAVLPETATMTLRRQLAAAPGARVTVDLVEQKVSGPDGEIYAFEVPPVRRKCLLEGLDEIGRTKQYAAGIDEFENAYRQRRSWLFQPRP